MFDVTDIKEGKITNRKIKEVSIALKETSINIHGYFINSILAFATSLSDLLSQEVVTPFMQS